METATDNNWHNWYQTFDTNHSPEVRRQWYSKAAEAYRWARPKYPDALIDHVLHKAGLTKSDSILEIGCGPGIATESLAARGLRVQAIDPSPAACELARKSCKAYSQVTVHNSTFEDYPLTQQTFDAVLAATSLHWVSPAVASQKSAAALKPGGSLILLWATPPQPSEAVYQQLQAVYDRFNLSELGHHQHRSEAYYRQNFETFAHSVGITDSKLFQPTEVTIQTHRSAYSGKKYLALLSTLSDYIALAEDIRLDLFNALEQCLKQWLAQDITAPDVTAPDVTAPDVTAPDVTAPDVTAPDVTADKLALTHWFAAQVIPLK